MEKKKKFFLFYFWRACNNAQRIDENGFILFPQLEFWQCEKQREAERNRNKVKEKPEKISFAIYVLCKMCFTQAVTVCELFGTKGKSDIAESIENGRAKKKIAYRTNENVEVQSYTMLYIYTYRSNTVLEYNLYVPNFKLPQ